MLCGLSIKPGLTDSVLGPFQLYLEVKHNSIYFTWPPHLEKGLKGGLGASLDELGPQGDRLSHPGRLPIPGNLLLVVRPLEPEAVQEVSGIEDMII